MRRAAIIAVTLGLMAGPSFAGSTASISGEYVEARTAEVFTGGCIMGSEAETMGRQALLAWRVGEGSYAGVPLDGLAVVAAVVGDRNLGIREIGGLAPGSVRSLVMVDDRATPAQRDALVGLARHMARGLVDDITGVIPVPITFDRDAEGYSIRAGDATLTVETALEHDASCGAMQWFKPLASVDAAEIGRTKVQVFWGEALGSKWRQADRRSAFFGTFSH